ncbi:hypothetical protein [Natronococcus wangiae]|uniref:hypothetical protein n=1 Tax=Natronococcus wangiae TaxID=3068275 RepID=UPI00273DCE72|nr:hypothetical protein [Natronococcus sp. AD5]
MKIEDPYLIGLLERDVENPAVGTFPPTVSSTAFDAVTRGDLIYWGEWSDQDSLVITRHRPVYDTDSRFTELGQSMLDSDGATTLPPPVVDRIKQWAAEKIHFVRIESIPMVCLLMTNSAFQTRRNRRKISCYLSSAGVVTRSSVPTS